MNPVPSGGKQVVVRPSARKVAALRQLGALSVRVSDGYDYQLHDMVQPDVTLEQVRDALKGVPDSLSELILEERRQR